MTKPKPQYAIVSDCDRPEPRLICELINGKYYYMGRAFEKGLRSYALDAQRDVTPVEDFGFMIVRRAYQTDFTLVGPSTATYHDGRPREWQSHEREFSMPNVILDNKEED